MFFPLSLFAPPGAESKSAEGADFFLWKAEKMFILFGFDSASPEINP